METESPRYPARLEIDYPARDLGRISTLLRPLAAIPIVVLLALVTQMTVRIDTDNYVIGAGGMVFLATLLMLLFRRKYPRWWFDWNLALTRFSMRVSAYLALLRDEYPATDEEQAVHLDIDYPDASRDLNRWLPLVKWLLAIPHYVVLAFLSIAALACIVIAWFAILFTGRYPRSLFRFVTGVLRWWLRVTAYAFLLATDRYPPFSTRA